MAVGMELLKPGEADAFVTAGNTGGAMANALFRLGRIRGVKRPAPDRRSSRCATARPSCSTSAPMPTAAGVPRPVRHLRLALRRDRSCGTPSPRVALLSNGEEAGKGNALVKETYPLLEAAGLNFVGNIEPKEFYAGKADVVVTDGFTGNVLLKTSRGGGLAS